MCPFFLRVSENRDSNVSGRYMSLFTGPHVRYLYHLTLSNLIYGRRWSSQTLISYYKSRDEIDGSFPLNLLMCSDFAVLNLICPEVIY